MWPRDVNDVMHWKRAQRILGIWKKVSESSCSVWRRRLTFRAHRSLAAGATHGGGSGGGADGKVVIERLCLSLPYVEKPLNSKVIKSFVSELRSRKCFLCFGIPVLSIYELWTFYVHFTYPYICLLWVCYICKDELIQDMSWTLKDSWMNP